MKFLIIFSFAVIVGILASCGKSVDLAYPLKDGARWNYQLIIPEDKYSTGSQVVIKNLQFREIDGNRVLPQQIQLFLDKQTKPSQERNYLLAEDSNGIYIFAPKSKTGDKPSTKYYLIKYPIQEGSTWTTTTFSDFPKLQATSTVESTTELVTVPAGTFENCVKIKVVATPDESEQNFNVFLPGQTLAQGSIWFAPKIGVVKATLTSSLSLGRGREADTMATYTFQLESYLN